MGVGRWVGGERGETKRSRKNREERNCVDKTRYGRRFRFLREIIQGERKRKDPENRLD